MSKEINTKGITQRNILYSRDFRTNKNWHSTRINFAILQNVPSIHFISKLHYTLCVTLRVLLQKKCMSLTCNKFKLVVSYDKTELLFSVLLFLKPSGYYIFHITNPSLFIFHNNSNIQKPLLDFVEIVAKESLLNETKIVPLHFFSIFNSIREDCYYLKVYVLNLLGPLQFYCVRLTTHFVAKEWSMEFATITYGTKVLRQMFIYSNIYWNTFLK